MKHGPIQDMCNTIWHSCILALVTLPSTYALNSSERNSYGLPTCGLALHPQSICISIYLSVCILWFVSFNVFFTVSACFIVTALFFSSFFSYREMLYCLTLFLCYWDYGWKLASCYNPAFLHDLTCSSMCTVPFK